MCGRVSTMRTIRKLQIHCRIVVPLLSTEVWTSYQLSVPQSTIWIVSIHFCVWLCACVSACWCRHMKALPAAHKGLLPISHKSPADPWWFWPAVVWFRTKPLLASELSAAAGKTCHTDEQMCTEIPRARKDFPVIPGISFREIFYDAIVHRCSEIIA